MLAGNIKPSRQRKSFSRRRPSNSMWSACTYFCFSAKVQSHSRIAKMAEGQEDPKKITITVKTPKEKQQVEIEEDADIKKVSTAPPETLPMA